MNFNKIITLFLIGLPFCVATRVVQIALAIENSNGFYAHGKETLGNVLTIFIALICVALIAVAFKAYKAPEKAPGVNRVLTAASFCVAFSLIGETFFENMPQTMLAWQVLAVKAVTLFCGVYFVVFGLQGFTGIKIPPLMQVIPCVYAIVKTIFTFINISSLALISDNLLLVAGYCLLMLFFISFGKLYNRIDTGLNSRKILAAGMGSAALCITQSLAYFGVNIFGKGYSHSDPSVMVTLFSLGFFIIAFVISYFRKTAE